MAVVQTMSWLSSESLSWEEQLVPAPSSARGQQSPSTHRVSPSEQGLGTQTASVPRNSSLQKVGNDNWISSTVLNLIALACVSILSHTDLCVICATQDGDAGENNRLFPESACVLHSGLHWKTVTHHSRQRHATLRPILTHFQYNDQIRFYNQLQLNPFLDGLLQIIRVTPLKQLFLRPSKTCCQKSF